MKKYLIIAITLLLAAGFYGCGSGTDRTNVNNSNNKAEISSQPQDNKEVGGGEVVIFTPSGRSENGNIPVKFVQKDKTYDSIGVTLSNFQEDKEIFLFLNGKINVKVPGGKKIGTGFTLRKSEGNLNPGIYTVTIAQYENNNQNGKVVEYHQAKYEVKQQ